MLEAVRLLAVICVVSQEGHAKVLDGLTISSEMAMLGKNSIALSIAWRKRVGIGAMMLLYMYIVHGICV